MSVTVIASRGHDDAHLLLGKLDGVVYRRENPTEAYVSVPPALLITDTDGGTFTLGSEYAQRGQVFEWNVKRNDIDLDQMASHIEYRNGVVTIYGVDGRRTWSRRHNSFI